jgi:hypothetical protein
MKITSYLLKKNGLVLLFFISLFGNTSIAATFTVSSTGSTGPGTYRQAVIDANASPGADVIVFTISGTIILGAGAPIPPITDTLHIDGTTAPGYTLCGVPMITLEGAFAGTVNGIQVLGGGSRTIVQAINIRNFELNGIMLLDADSCYIRSCTIGVNSSAWSATANGGNGIQIEGGANDNVIGGAGCEGNLISGNIGSGISINGSLRNDILGNVIGLHINGNAAIPNQSHGIYVTNNSHYTSIGGLFGIGGNVISGNGSGLNGNGIFIENSVGCNIRVNYIGLNVAGTTGIGNAENGISLNNAPFTVIGGSSLVDGNIIADHNFHAILLTGTNNSLILGNNCGTNAAGTAVIPNDDSGLALINCNNLTIGGGTNFEKNVFSGSTSEYGIFMTNVSNAIIVGNYIGTDRSGTLDMGNSGGGIRFDSGAGNSIIGGTFPSAANTIAFNSGYGIAVLNAGTNGVAIRQNSIYCNTGPGIDLAGVGNNNIASPIITSASTVGCSGTAEPNSSIEVFYDSTCTSTCQGKDYIGTVMSNGTGAWSLSVALSGGSITATTTDGSNNTSEFSTCVPINCAPSINTISPTACGSYTSPSGNTWTSSSTYLDTIPNSNGCDSIITINLTVNANSGASEIITACDSYTWIDGVTYTSSNNTATFTETNAVGCDSIITLDLTINNSSASVDVASACQSYTWMNGITYIASNNVSTFTTTNAAGCDSIITLNLTITNASTFTDVLIGCDSLTWIDGNTYTSNNNTATFTTTNVAGCDSIITLDLTISGAPNVSLQPFVDICSNAPFINLIGASPSGGTYSGSGVSGNTFIPSVPGVGTVNVTYTYTDANGCIGSVSEPITVIPSTTPTLSAFSAVCKTDPAFTLTGGLPAGGSYSGAGTSGGMFDPNVAGAGLHTIVYSFTDPNGCTGAASQVLTVDECLSLESLEELNIAIVPNPANDFFTITTTAEITAIDLLELSGRTVQRFDASAHEFDVSNLPTGVYIVRIAINGHYFQQRLVVQ